MSGRIDHIDAEDVGSGFAFGVDGELQGRRLARAQAVVVGRDVQPIHLVGQGGKEHGGVGADHRLHPIGQSIGLAAEDFVEVLLLRQRDPRHLRLDGHARGGGIVPQQGVVVHRAVAEVGSLHKGEWFAFGVRDAHQRLEPGIGQPASGQ